MQLIMQKLIVIELPPRGSMLMKVEAGNGNKRKRSLEYLEQRKVGYPKKDW